MPDLFTMLLVTFKAKTDKKEWLKLVDEAAPSKMAQIWLMSSPIVNKKRYLQNSTVKEKSISPVKICVASIIYV